MINSNYNMKGELNIVLTDENGNVKLTQHVPNLVVSVGKNYIAQRIANNTTTVMGYMSVGGSSATPTVADTLLGSEMARVAVGTDAANTNINANTVTYVGTFGPGVGTGALQEAGIFNASGANTGAMLCHTTYSVINKGSLDTLTISWSVSAT